MDSWVCVGDSHPQRNPYLMLTCVGDFIMTPKDCIQRREVIRVFHILQKCGYIMGLS
jgi:hypothetical protein